MPEPKINLFSKSHYWLDVETVEILVFENISLIMVVGLHLNNDVLYKPGYQTYDVTAGANIPDLGSWRNKAYSMQQDDGISSTVFTDTNYGGYQLTYTCDTSTGQSGEGFCQRTDFNDTSDKFDALIKSVKTRKLCNNRRWMDDPDCTSWYSDNCITPANLGNQQCADYCAKGQNAATCSAAQLKFCAVGNNAITSQCQTFCNTDSNAGKCDALRIQYCKNNPKDYNYCACQNLTPAAEAAQKVLTNAGLTSITECTVAACRSNPSAWLTAQQQKTVCPAQNVCLQTLNATLAESQVAGVSYNCNISSTNTNAAGQTTTSATAPTSTGTSGSSATSTKVTTSTANADLYYIAGGVIAACIVLSCLGVLSYKVMSGKSQMKRT